MLFIHFKTLIIARLTHDLGWNISEQNSNQKSGNAIRALGRLATLSANSRRQTAASVASISNEKPNGVQCERTQFAGNQRLQIENMKTTDITLTPTIMLHKSISADLADEIDHVSQIEQQTMSAIEFGIVPIPTNERKDRMCAERSDSGFSDRSTSSNGCIQSANAANKIANVALIADDALRDIATAKIEEKVHPDTKVNILKKKLTEKMAEAHNDGQSSQNTNKKVINKLAPTYLIESNVHGIDKMDYMSVQHQSINSSQPIESSRRSSMNEPTDVGVEKPNPMLIRSASLRQTRIVDREPIMRSDFTNTVKMRKKSLECNALREKLAYSSRVILEPIGKVSKLLRRFDSRDYSATSTSSNSSINSPTVESPQIEKDLEELSIDTQFNSQDPQQADKVFEPISIPLAAQSIKSPKYPPNPSKSFTNPNAKHINKSKCELTNMKMSVHSMDLETSLPSRLLIDSPLTTNSRLTHQSNPFTTSKKFRKSTTAETMERPLSNTHRSGKVHATRTTAYASFNRTSPVRLSGRVKEVTVCINTKG